MYCENLENLVLERHKDNNADELLILGGWIGFNTPKKLSKRGISTKLIYGCIKRADLNKKAHKNYVDLTNESNSISIFYKKNYNHSKIYCWLKNKKVVQILAGSANFSVSGLCNDYQEVLFDIKEEDFDDTYNFLKEALEDSELCTEYNFIPKKEIKVRSQKVLLDRIISHSPPRARISLRSSKGKFEDSGINVGQKSKTGSHVNINDCYVPIRSELIDQLPDLFPNKGINIKVGSGYGREAKKLTSNAEFLFDDGEVIEISFEQKGPKRENGFLYKAFRSFRPNSKLGEYLRKRMNIQKGAPFTELDFKNYGRDDIELTLLAEGQYYADFSV